MFLISLTMDEASARHVSQMLGEMMDPETVAVSAFEVEGGTNRHPPWQVDIYLQQPDPDPVLSLVRAWCGTEPQVQALAERDWIRDSLQGLSPVSAGRWTVHGRHDRGRFAENRTSLEIEAALAFGTGHHGTTQGCLLALASCLKLRRPGRILDIGTGTGVLGIAAARQLKSKVIASDIDPVAVHTARANAWLNGAGPWLEVHHANGVTAPLRERGPYDLVMANILAGPLIRMSAALASLLAAGGILIVSGLLHEQAPAVTAAYRRQTLRLQRRLARDEWTTLVFTK